MIRIENHNLESSEYRQLWDALLRQIFIALHNGFYFSFDRKKANMTREKKKQNVFFFVRRQGFFRQTTAVYK